MTTKTFHLGLIGYPLGHSLSPQIHNAALRSKGFGGEYKLYPVEPHQFEDNSKLGGDNQSINIDIFDH